ncbi:MAG: hypothetical protein WC718_07415 [Phycisphaerales bacterium]|jgi:hypothetical protein
MKANLVSTLLGIPLTWLSLVTLMGVLAYLGVGDERISAIAFLPMRKAPPWVVPLAGLALCLPFCLASAYIEWRLFREYFQSVGAAHSKRIMLEANALSYLIVAAFWVFEMVYQTSLRS